MKLTRLFAATAGLACLAAPLAPALAFCGFYVAKADTQLFNEASKVVIARHGGKTVITMVNDYQGEPKDFAMVIPVPEVLERGQIHVTDTAVVEHLDAYTAPRLVEYFDPDPCVPAPVFESLSINSLRASSSRAVGTVSADALGVTIEARYTVGEYDILILSAEESRGLAAWLTGNGYKLPEGAAPLLADYLAQGMKFFVARVNLEARSKLGFTFLRPLQIAFESDGFMLPIRLGMVNARGPQELYVFTLTKGGRVETANYRTLRMPSDLEVPLFVRSTFDEVYRAAFERQFEKEDGRAVFLEYAWDMAWCDPCAADPLRAAELRELGVFWAAQGAGTQGIGTQGIGTPARNVFVTRLHLRYDAAHFPDDLRFRETGDRTNFQGRYVLRHPWTGESSCEAAEAYRRALPARFEREAAGLAALTAWPIAEIRARMETNGQSFAVPARDQRRWWEKLWDKSRLEAPGPRRNMRG